MHRREFCESMHRREFLRKSIGLAGCMALGSSATATISLANKTLSMRLGKRRPNVIYILADDLGYADAGCYGQEKIKTPNIDKMAAEGMRFTQHYSGSTVCAPARCSLMTGQHTGHCYIRGNSSVALRDEDVTVAEIFKQAGYKTACIGKWGLGEIGTTGHPNDQGFDYYYGYLSQSAAHHYYPDTSDPIWENKQNASLDGQTYSHDVFTEKALNVITQNENNPFFLYLPYAIPHAELLVPDEPDLTDYRALGWPETPWGCGHYGAQPTPHAAYAAMVTRMDRDVGRIMTLLKKLRLDNDTLVIFTSDNGPHAEGGGDPTFFDSNGPLRGIKRALYDGGIRVPMVARWPGKIKPGATTDHISAFWDFLPTCADLLGVKTPSVVDGISLLPTLLNQTQTQQHQYLYWEFHEGSNKQAARKGKWKGVRLNVRTVSDPPVELYDLETDIGETTDVSGTYPAIAAELKQIMLDAHEYSSNFKLLYGE
ncbi:MAG: arylsulfatase [Phycisphaerae bacterium]|nr:arylsulfatase [Phycisphaerae bacterium]